MSFFISLFPKNPITILIAVSSSESYSLFFYIQSLLILHQCNLWLQSCCASNFLDLFFPFKSPFSFSLSPLISDFVSTPIPTSKSIPVKPSKCFAIFFIAVLVPFCTHTTPWISSTNLLISLTFYFIQLRYLSSNIFDRSGQLQDILPDCLSHHRESGPCLFDCPGDLLSTLIVVVASRVYFSVFWTQTSLHLRIHSLPSLLLQTWAHIAPRALDLAGSASQTRGAFSLLKNKRVKFGIRKQVKVMCITYFTLIT